ncbi:peptidyl-prolyl cis-trans isomerase [Aureococcus anophagefferens]|nr:peptidyl-prolyl cis-trans isomerase [Aureococcus anophagefferens]
MIEDKFGVFGKVTDVFLPMDANHKPRGFAFVTFSEAREAEDCAENLNDKDVAGPPRRRDDYDGPRGGGPRGGGYGYRDDFRDRPPPPNRIYVYGLPDDIREREIDDLYYRYGRIDYIEIRRSAKMYAVVCYFEPRDADYAQRETDGMRFERKILRVDLDR